MRKEYEVVRLRRSLSGIPAGTRGTVLVVSEDPKASMTVEFQFSQPEDSQIIDVHEDDLEPTT
jgi:hypothetical protein